MPPVLIHLRHSHSTRCPEETARPGSRAEVPAGRRRACAMHLPHERPNVFLTFAVHHSGVRTTDQVDRTQTSRIARVVAAVLCVALLPYAGTAISNCGAAGDCDSRCGAHLATTSARDCCENVVRPEPKEAISEQRECRCAVQAPGASTGALTSRFEPRPPLRLDDVEPPLPSRLRSAKPALLAGRSGPPCPGAKPLFLATSALLI